MSAIANPTLVAEHGALVDVCERLLADLGAGTARLRRGRTADSRHDDFVDRLDLLASTLRSALDLIALNDYPSAFVVVRTGLEHHLLDRLVFLANRLQFRYAIKARDVRAEEARLLALQTSTRPDILRWKIVGGKFTVIISGIHQTGRIGKPPTISPYWLMLDQYDPFTGKRSHQSRLARGFTAPKFHKKAASDAWDLWSTRFAPAGLSRSLQTNRLITRAQSVQIDVHYGFLSAFVHPSSRAADLALGRNRPRRVRGFDHYCSELGLLYIATIAAEELTSFARACKRRPSCGLNGWAAVEADLAAAHVATADLWFLRGEPHALDRFHEANARMIPSVLRGGPVLRVDPAKLSARQVHYYRNPLVRIIELHHDINELSTGLRFASPTPRPDAWSRV